MSGRIWRALLVVLAAGAVAAPGAAASAHAKVNLLTVESNVMCTTCHEPLELAQSAEADRERAYIKELIGQGLTLKQIESRLVAQYGIAVLGKPPAGGFNLTVYVLPPVLLVLGLGFLAYSLPKWRARARSARPLEAQPPLERQDADRLDEDLARFI